MCSMGRIAAIASWQLERLHLLAWGPYVTLAHAMDPMEQCNTWTCISVAGRRLQERPYRYLDRASVEGGCGALAAVTELRLAAPVREDSESSSATCGDSPTSTIQLIVKRDS